MKYLCYDSALNEEYTLITLMKRYPQQVSLFAGTDDEGIWDAAPWLFVAKDNFYELQGQPLIQLARCVVFETKESLKDVCDFLHTKMYRTVEGQQQYYRIWDAPVLLKYLEHGTEADRQVFFQVFDAVYTEKDAETLTRWTLQGNRLQSSQVRKAEALPVIPDELVDEEEEEPHAEVKAPPVVMTVKEEEPVKEEPQPEAPKRRRFFMD